ncbi:hypothetical protein Bhyg_13079 [Pseudolycoriella hygida]|uniref:Uncharacterized protein n=1 Tax=Pseudolycoriella hygida TaxID=35572 RepID=A0A9Q0N043_9DIPT|nr:hypothetical protein Bhyg_13079 [Pseudolycoriella hygida]
MNRKLRHVESLDVVREILGSICVRGGVFFYFFHEIFNDQWLLNAFFMSTNNFSFQINFVVFFGLWLIIFFKEYKC